MRAFTLKEIETVRSMRRARRTVSAINNCLHRHSRNEIVEAMDATLRYDDDQTARIRVNAILTLDAMREPVGRKC